MHSATIVTNFAGNPVCQQSTSIKRCDLQWTHSINHTSCCHFWGYQCGFVRRAPSDHGIRPRISLSWSQVRFLFLSNRTFDALSKIQRVFFSPSATVSRVYVSSLSWSACTGVALPRVTPPNEKHFGLVAPCSDFKQRHWGGMAFRSSISFLVCCGFQVHWLWPQWENEGPRSWPAGSGGHGSCSAHQLQRCVLLWYFENCRVEEQVVGQPFGRRHV